jgi:small nuclear ribonucleoprotein D3
MVTRGIPVQLLHEAESHAVTVEIKNGEIYRGMLLRSQDNMNLELTQVTHSGRDGKISKMEQVFIRGSQIRFIVVPDLLKKAPMFETISAAGKAAQEQIGSYNMGSNSKKMIDRIPGAQ